MRGADADYIRAQKNSEEETLIILCPIQKLPPFLAAQATLIHEAMAHQTWKLR